MKKGETLKQISNAWFSALDGVELQLNICKQCCLRKTIKSDVINLYLLKFRNKTRKMKYLYLQNCSYEMCKQ